MSAASGIWSLSSSASGYDPLKHPEESGPEKNSNMTSSQIFNSPTVHTGRPAESQRWKIHYPIARALYVYDAQSIDELPLQIGDVVVVLDSNVADQGWSFGVTASNRRGLAPASYLKILDEHEVEQAWDSGSMPSPAQIQSALEFLKSSIRHQSLSVAKLALLDNYRQSAYGDDMNNGKSIKSSPISSDVTDSNQVRFQSVDSSANSSNSSNANSNTQNQMNKVRGTSRITPIPKKALQPQSKSQSKDPISKPKPAPSLSSSTSARSCSADATNPINAPNIVYDLYLKQAKNSTFNDIAPIQPIFPTGLDDQGRPIFVILGTRLAKIPKVKQGDVFALDLERIFQFAIILMDPLLASDYVVIYVHDPALKEAMSGYGSRPFLAWLRKARSILSRKYKKNLAHLYIVRPTMWVKVIINFFVPLTSPKFWRNKMTVFNSVDQLYSAFNKRQLTIPKDIWEKERLWAQDDQRGSTKLVTTLTPEEIQSGAIPIFGSNLTTLLSSDRAYAKSQRLPQPRVPVFFSTILNALEALVEQNPDIITSLFGNSQTVDIDAVVTIARMCDSVSVTTNRLMNPSSSITVTPKIPTSTQSSKVSSSTQDDRFDFLHQVEEPAILLALLKRWLRRLPEPLLSSQIYPDLTKLVDDMGPLPRLFLLRQHLAKTNPILSGHWDSAIRFFQFLYRMAHLYVAKSQENKAQTSPMVNVDLTRVGQDANQKQRPALPPRKNKTNQTTPTSSDASSSVSQVNSSSNKKLNIQDLRSYWLGPMGVIALSGREDSQKARKISRMTQDSHSETITYTVVRQLAIVFAPNLIRPPVESSFSLFHKTKSPQEILSEARSSASSVCWIASYPEYCFAPFSYSSKGCPTWVSSFNPKVPLSALPRNPDIATNVPYMPVILINYLRKTLGLGDSFEEIQPDPSLYVSGLFVTDHFSGTSQTNLISRELLVRFFVVLDTPIPFHDRFVALGLATSQTFEISSILNHIADFIGLDSSFDTHSLYSNIVVETLKIFLSSINSKLIPCLNLNSFLSIADSQESSTRMILLESYLSTNLNPTHSSLLYYLVRFIGDLADAAEAAGDQLENESDDDHVDFGDSGATLVSSDNPIFRLCTAIAPYLVDLSPFDKTRAETVLQTKVVPLLILAVLNCSTVFANVDYPKPFERFPVAQDDQTVLPDDDDYEEEYNEEEDDDTTAESLLSAVRGLRFSTLLLDDDDANEVDESSESTPSTASDTSENQNSHKTLRSKYRETLGRSSIQPRMSILDSDSFIKASTSSGKSTPENSSATNAGPRESIRFSILSPNPPKSSLAAYDTMSMKSNTPKGKAQTPGESAVVAQHRSSHRASMRFPAASASISRNSNRMSILADSTASSSSSSNRPTEPASKSSNSIVKTSSPCLANSILKTFVGSNRSTLPLTTICSYRIFGNLNRKSQNQSDSSSNRKSGLFAKFRSKKTDTAHKKIGKFNWKSLLSSFSPSTPVFQSSLNNDSEEFVSFWNTEWQRCVSLCANTILEMGLKLGPSLYSQLAKVLDGAPITSVSISDSIWNPPDLDLTYENIYQHIQQQIVPLLSSDSTQLSILQLTNCSIPPPSILQLVKNNQNSLERLEIVSCAQLEEGWFGQLAQKIQKMPRLRFLKLRDSAVSAQTISTLMPKCPIIESVDVSLSEVLLSPDAPLFPPSTLNTLVTLNLFGCQVSDAGLATTLLIDVAENTVLPLTFLDLAFTGISEGFFDVLAADHSEQYDGLELVTLDGTPCHAALSSSLDGAGVPSTGIIWLLPRFGMPPESSSFKRTMGKNRRPVCNAVAPTRMLIPHSPFFPMWFHILTNTINSWTQACFSENSIVDPSILHWLENCVFFDKDMVLSNHGLNYQGSHNSGVAWGLDTVTDDSLLWSHMRFSDKDLVMVGYGPAIPHPQFYSQSLDMDVLSELDNTEKACFWLEYCSTDPAATRLNDQTSDSSSPLAFYSSDLMPNWESKKWTQSTPGQLYLALQPDIPPQCWIPLGRDIVSFVTALSQYFSHANLVRNLSQAQNSPSHPLQFSPSPSFIKPLYQFLHNSSKVYDKALVTLGPSIVQSRRLFLDYVPNPQALEVSMRHHPFVKPVPLITCLSQTQLAYFESDQIDQIVASNQPVTTVSSFVTNHSNSIITFVSPSNLVINQQVENEMGFVENNFLHPVFIHVDYTPNPISCPPGQPLPLSTHSQLLTLNTILGADFSPDLPYDVAAALCHLSSPKGTGYFANALVEDPSSHYMALYALVYMTTPQELSFLVEQVGQIHLESDQRSIIQEALGDSSLYSSKCRSILGI